MFLIPSICDNPSCKTTILTSINAKGDSMTLTDCEAGSCPQCGSTSSIPSGEYKSFPIDIFETFFKIGDIDKLQRIKDSIEKAFHDKSKRKRLNDKLNSIAPEKSSEFSIVDWTKENDAVILIILSFLTLLITAFTLMSADPPVNITFNNIVNQTFNQFNELHLNDAPSEMQIENKNIHTKPEEI